MPPVDEYATYAGSPLESPRRHVAIVPSDDADLAELPVAIYCQADGTIVLCDETGNDLPYAMTAGQVLDFRPVRVLATGTTGTFYAWF